MFRNAAKGRFKSIHANTDMERCGSIVQISNPVKRTQPW